MEYIKFLNGVSEAKSPKRKGGLLSKLKRAPTNLNSGSCREFDQIVDRDKEMLQIVSK